MILTEVNNMTIDMEFIKKEIKNQVTDKLDNMLYSEISEELYRFLKNKKRIICKFVYEVLSNNECVIEGEYFCLNAQDGFTDDLILNWDYIEELEGEEREKEIQSTILYNYDALWMTAIHKALPDNTTNTQCGYGEMDLIK
jgi:6-pyruvoyl-tetrahydropterin synthase